ncbi:hypothetical protein CRG98_009607 [Punica granatum]|uniref:Uncharacterized protein n=1 Tax=Punica granatum TaxID=22663 RepID=A0A2I0KNE7_PUNGR|nr:hypothetical protein CRG98_009607 [Punica granatum]
MDSSRIIIGRHVRVVERLSSSDPLAWIEREHLLSRFKPIEFTLGESLESQFPLKRSSGVRYHRVTTYDFMNSESALAVAIEKPKSRIFTLWVTIGVDEDVLGRQIPMEDSCQVYVVEAAQYLEDKVPDLVLE